MFILKSSSSAQTREIGRQLGEILPAGTVLALDGELGAGKTVFAQGVALGLGVEEQVTSPTFVLMHIYQGRLTFYHFDFYRLDEEAELESLGLEEYFDGEGIVLVEWAGKFSDALPAARLEITIVRDETGDEDARLLCVKPRGDLMSVILEEWSRRCCY